MFWWTGCIFLTKPYAINPEDVESVEVIINPSVEYGSEVANVVNIILKVERESLMESEKDVEQKK